MQRVAVIGAGPGGIVAARYLRSEGLEPVLFEQGARLGGQWSGDPAHSGVWPSMRTNTSRIMTSFSDLPHDDSTPTYPTNTAMGEYLERYARQFDLTPLIRFKTPYVSCHTIATVSGWFARMPARRYSTRSSSPPAVTTSPRIPKCQVSTPSLAPAG